MRSSVWMREASPLPSTDRAIGIDVGLTALPFSRSRRGDSEYPRHYRKAEARFAALNAKWRGGRISGVTAAAKRFACSNAPTLTW